MTGAKGQFPQIFSHKSPAARACPCDVMDVSGADERKKKQRHEARADSKTTHVCAATQTHRQPTLSQTRDPRHKYNGRDLDTPVFALRLTSSDVFKQTSAFFLSFFLSASWRALFVLCVCMRARVPRLARAPLASEAHFLLETLIVILGNLAQIQVNISWEAFGVFYICS